MGSEDELSNSENEGADGSVATANAFSDSVPVDVSGSAVAKLRCKLCHASPTELSPLALSTDPNPARFEWRQYWKKKIQGKLVAKVPRSRLCNWCDRTFF